MDLKKIWRILRNHKILDYFTPKTFSKIYQSNLEMFLCSAHFRFFYSSKTSCEHFVLFDMEKEQEKIISIYLINSHCWNFFNLLSFQWKKSCSARQGAFFQMLKLKINTIRCLITEEESRKCTCSKVCEVAYLIQWQCMCSWLYCLYFFRWY